MRLFIVLLIGFASGYFVSDSKIFAKPKKEQSSKDFTTATQGDLIVKIEESGSLKAKRSIRIYSGLQRTAKIIYLVPEGSRIKKNDVLMKFDSKEVKSEIKNLEQKIRAAKTRHETAEGDMDIQKTEGKNEGAKAKLDYEEAQKNLEKYIKGEYPLAEKEKQVKLEEAESNLKRAQAKLKQMPGLLKEGFVTPDRLEQEKINLKKAEVAYDTAKSQLYLLIKYTKPLEIQKKQAEITKTKSERYAKKKQLQAKLRQKEVEIESLELEIENHNLELSVLREEESKMVVYSPTDGLIIHGDPDSWWSRGNIQVGKDVEPDTTIITLPDLTQMQVAFSVHEMDVRHIKKEMLCTIIIEAAGDFVCSGKVTKIAELARGNNDWLSNAEVKQFDIDVVLNESNEKLKPGTTAKVELIINHLKNVILLPVKYIHATDEKYYCYVKENNALKKHFVKIGLSNDEFVEIRSGLTKGTEVFFVSQSKKITQKTSQKKIP